MTTYNTQNPVGSADPRDLYDNAQVIDDYANSAGDTTTDRLGVERATIAGIDAAARAAIANAGYEFVGDYAAGIELTAYNQVVREAGEFWRVSGAIDLPYTTTGAGMPEGGAFVTVGDGNLRQDLVQPVATFNNVQDMKDATGLDVGRKVRTLGYYAPGDGGGNDYEAVAAGTGTDDGGSFIDLAGSGTQAKGLYDSEITVTVPGDFQSLQSAVDNYASSEGNRERSVNVVIEAGHAIESGVLVKDGDFSFIKISSIDAVVSVSGTFSGVTTLDIEARDSGSSDNIFLGVNARMPVLGCAINASGSPATGGYVAANGSIGQVLPGSGISHCGTHGCHAFGGSVINAMGSAFTDCQLDNYRASLMSDINAQGATADRAGAICIHITRNSRGHFQEASAVNGAGRGVRCARSKLNLTNAVVKNNTTTDVFYSEGSEVSAQGLETTNGFPSMQDFAGSSYLNELTRSGYASATTGDGEGRGGTITGRNSFGDWRIDPDGRCFMSKDVLMDTSSPGTVQLFPFPILGFKELPSVALNTRGGANRATSGLGGPEKRRAAACTVVALNSGNDAWEVVVDPNIFDTTGGLADYSARLTAEAFVDIGPPVENV